MARKAGQGAIQLPDFQRGWVWADHDIRGLLASISQSFPVGALMTLETGGAINFKPRPVEGAPSEARTVAPEALLLDGQQRITSLFQTTIRRAVVETINAKKNAIKRWYYINIERALDPETTREDAIIGLPENRRHTTNFGRDIHLDLSTPDLEYQQMMFPVNQIFNDRDWEHGFEDYTRSAILDLPLSSYRHHADRVERGFDLAARFLRTQKIYRVKDIPYRTQIVPLAAILSELGDMWDQGTVRARIRQWFWCGIFGERLVSRICG